MRKLKRSDGMIYLAANFMPDCRYGHFQIDDVLNLFLRRHANLRMNSDGYNVFLLKTPLHRPASEKVLVRLKLLIMSLFGTMLYGCGPGR